MKPTIRGLPIKIAGVAIVLSTWLLAGCCAKNNGPNGETAGTCAGACHGDATSEAPAADVAGHTETTHRGVGAHRAHLEQGTTSRALECNECHVVPESVGDLGHDDTQPPADLTFGGVAVKQGAVPDFDGEKCNNTYCHNPKSKIGSKPLGGDITAPSWTKVDGSQNSCGTACHALPPPYSEDTGFLHKDPMKPCKSCHKWSGDDNVFKDPTQHVNGVAETN